MNETLEILTNEKRCCDCLEFDQLRFLYAPEPGWCKEQSTFAGPDWKICDSFKERKVSNAD